METLIVGAGAMGQWVGATLTDPTASVSPPGSAASCTVSYYDQDPAAAEQAASATGTRAVTTPDESYDLVCIAVPIPAAATAIAAHASRAQAAAIDLTGTMTEPVDALAQHAAGVERASFHPLFSPDNEPGNVPVVVDADGPTVAFVRDRLTERGNEVFETTAAEHDEAMETVQSQAHAAILAYALAGESAPDRFQTTVSRQLDSLVEQVTGGESRVYADIQAAFDGADEVADAAASIADADRETFEKLYDQIT
jgi:prephenate dehydrogenase